jgi:hypothetical protein
MTKYYTEVWNDDTKKFEVIELPVVSETSVILPTSEWQDVTSKVLFGFNGLRQWPNLGVGGEFTAEAFIQNKKVDLRIFGKIGTGATFPSNSAWYFYMLAPELQAKNRAIGTLAMYLDNGGSLFGDCRFLYKADANPPYYPLCLYYASTLPAGAGYLTSIYPWTWAERPNSWFLAQITYRTV